MSKKQERLKKLAQLMNTLHEHTDEQGVLHLTKHNTNAVRKHVEGMLNDEGVFILNKEEDTPLIS